jgi:hypothetical protein
MTGVAFASAFHRVTHEVAWILLLLRCREVIEPRDRTRIRYGWITLPPAREHLDDRAVYRFLEVVPRIHEDGCSGGGKARV